MSHAVTISPREAARRRMPLDGADAQALEGALSMTERERDEALRTVDALRRDAALGRAVREAAAGLGSDVAHVYSADDEGEGWTPIARIDEDQLALLKSVAEAVAKDQKVAR